MESLETTGATEEAKDLKQAERNDAINLTAKQSFLSEGREMSCLSGREGVSYAVSKERVGVYE